MISSISIAILTKFRCLVSLANFLVRRRLIQQEVSYNAFSKHQIILQMVFCVVCVSILRGRTIRYVPTFICSLCCKHLIWLYTYIIVCFCKLKTLFWLKSLSITKLLIFILEIKVFCCVCSIFNLNITEVFEEIYFLLSFRLLFYWLVYLVKVKFKSIV